MNAARLTLVLSLIAVIGTLIYMLIDGAVSLDHSRSQNEMLRAKCELLAKLTDDGLRGRTVDRVIKLAGAGVIAKIEGLDLWLDNVVLHVQDGKVTSVDVAETCGGQLRP